MKLARAICVAAAVSAVMYAAAAFVMWDVEWARDLPAWRPDSRAIFLWLMISIPTLAAAGYYTFPRRS
jgi:hypothetical protein